MTILSSGNVGIGTTNPTTKLQVAGEISPATDNSYSLGDGALRFTAVYATNGTIQTSDARQKKDVVNSDLGLDFIRRLRPVAYRWKSGPDQDLHYGLIAQETKRAVQQSRAPAAADTKAIVTRDGPSDRYGLRYSELLAPVIKAIQELVVWISGIQDQQKEQQIELDQLRAENQILKQRLDQIEKKLESR